jgi:hypothetical protein
MSLGQFLGGAGVVARGWREEEDAQRRSRQLQLQTDELNRLDRFRQEQLNAGMTQPLIEVDFGTDPDMGALPQRRMPPPAAPPAAPFGDGAFLGAGMPSSVDSWNRAAGLRPPAPTAAAGAQPATPTDQRSYDNISEVVRMREMRIRDMEQGLRRLEEGGGSARMIANQKERIARERQLLEASKASEARVGGQLETSQAQLRERITPTPQPPGAQQLLAAMIQVESNGRPNAVSNKGATGLMQVMPETAMRPGFGLPNIFDFAQQMNAEVRGRNKSEAQRLLKDPEVGAAYGQQYMQAMLDRYNNNLGYALVAYNWGPGNADKWIANGADFTKLPKETREYVPKVIGLLNPSAPPMPDIESTPTGISPPTAAPTPATSPSPYAATGVSPPTPYSATGIAPPAAQPAPVAAATNATATSVDISGTSDNYLANPRSIPLDMQRALQMRNEVEQLAKMYQRAGLGTQYTQARMKLMELDNSMTYLHGMQGVQEFSLANDPRRLQAVWSQYAGVPVGIQIRDDGKFDILVNGKRAREGMTGAQVTDLARSSFDSAFRQQKAQASAKYNEKAYESVLKREEESSKQYAQMIREVAVERVRGSNAQALEWMKANMGWDIKPTGAGDGTVIIRPPGQAPFVFNPTGRTVKIDGIEVPSNAAYPIAGLPSYGGFRP